MASVSSVGIGSGVLTSELIDNLAEAERAPTEARLDNQEAEINAELSVFGLIQSAITDLRLPSRSLANPSLFESKTITSGNVAFSGVVDTSAAAAGTHTLEVTALAKAHTLTSGNYTDSNVTTVGTGSLAITIGSATANITIDNTNNTLDGIAAAINNDDTVGVTASVLYTGTAYKLVLNSDTTGLDNVIDVAVTDTGDLDDTDTDGLSSLSYTSGGVNLVPSQAAVDAAFTLNGVSVTRATNTVTDAIPGVILSLNSTNIGAASSLIIADDDTAVVDAVTEFVDKFNALKTLINENSAFDSTGATENGVLLGDSTTRTIMSQVRRVLGSTVEGLENANVRSLAEVGISTDFQTGLLNFDSSVFKAKFASDPDDVSALFSDQGRTSDSQVTYEQAGIHTVPGTYAISVSTAATRGELSGSVSIGASTTIDANNDGLTIKVDGITSGAIALTAGSYTKAELVAEIQSKINADTTLSADGKGVVVSLDGSNQIVINSSIYGSSSKVEITAVDTNTVAQLGLSIAAGTTGVDVVGTINGATATGAGQILTAAVDDDSEGISVTVDGTGTGSRGTVTYIEGVGEQFVDKITEYISIDGALYSKTDTLTKALALIAEERTDLNERIETLTARLARQFTAADIIISQLNSTQDFVKRQLDALAGFGSSE